MCVCVCVCVLLLLRSFCHVMRLSYKEALCSFPNLDGGREFGFLLRVLLCKMEIEHMSQLSICHLSALNLPFLPWYVMLDLGPVNISLLPFSTSGRKGFLFWFQYFVSYAQSIPAEMALPPRDQKLPYQWCVSHQETQWHVRKYFWNLR